MAIDFTNIDIDNLSKEQAQELLDSPATMYDIAGLRKSNHHLANVMNGFIGTQELSMDDLKESMRRIEQSLMVRIVNGKEKLRPLHEVVGEMYERERPVRDRLKLKWYLKKYNIFIISMLLTILVLVFIFHNHISSIVNYIIQYKEASISIILFPFLLALLKKIFIKNRSK